MRTTVVVHTYTDVDKVMKTEEEEEKNTEKKKQNPKQNAQQ